MRGTHMTGRWRGWALGLAALCLAGGGLPRATQAQTDQRIVFASDRDGNTEIYIMDPYNGSAQRLTYDSAQDTDPVWSPDRGQIAFVSNRSGRYAVYLMAADGSGVRPVTPDDGSYYDSPAWSPDGRVLAVVSDRSGSLDIHTIQLTTLEIRPLTSDPPDDYDPAWSPDGRSLAFASFRDGVSAVYVISSGGGMPRPLIVRKDADVSAPAWSPDGQSLAYVATYGLFSDLMIASADGSSERLLMGVDNNYIRSPGWSLDGQSLVYELAPLNGNSTLQIMDVAGQSARHVTDATAGSYAPSWFTPFNPSAGPGPAGQSRVAFIRDLDLYIQVSHGDSPRLLVSTGDSYEPDLSGKWVVYASARNNRRLDLFLYDLETGQEHPLTSHDAQDRHPSFSPDGQQIAFASDRMGDWDIFVVNVDGSGLTQITSATSFEYAPTWSPDGRFLAYQSNQVGAEEIFLHDLETGAVRQLTNAAEPLVGALWSPGGDYIAGYANLDPAQVFVADASTGSILAWFGGVANEWLDAQTLLFHRRTNEVPSVYTFDVRTGAEALLIENASWSASEEVAVQRTIVAVTFVVTVPDYTNQGEGDVYIAGSFGTTDLPNWDPAGLAMEQVDATHWTITLDLPESAKLEYKYVRGTWDAVEKGPECEEIANRRLTVTLPEGADGLLVDTDLVAKWRDLDTCG